MLAGPPFGGNVRSAADLRDLKRKREERRVRNQAQEMIHQEHDFTEGHVASLMRMTRANGKAYMHGRYAAHHRRRRRSGT